VHGTVTVWARHASLRGMKTGSAMIKRFDAAAMAAVLLGLLSPCAGSLGA
jgi:hypothetical protein